MATQQTIAKIKGSLRISHNALDTEIADWIDSGLADLRMCGINTTTKTETDALILSALKLYCKAQLVEDMDVANTYMARYDAQKSCLMMAEGYGG